MLIKMFLFVLLLLCLVGCSIPNYITEAENLRLCRINLNNLNTVVVPELNRMCTSLNDKIRDLQRSKSSELFLKDLDLQQLRNNFTEKINICVKTVVNLKSVKSHLEGAVNEMSKKNGDLNEELGLFLIKQKCQ